MCSPSQKPWLISNQRLGIEIAISAKSISDSRTVVETWIACTPQCSLPLINSSPDHQVTHTLSIVFPNSTSPPSQCSATGTQADVPTYKPGPDGGLRDKACRTGRHRRPFFDVRVLNAMSRVPLASGKIVHPVGNDVGLKQRPVASQIFLLHGLAGILKPANDHLHVDGIPNHDGV